MEWYEETLHDGFRLRLRVSKVLHQEKTDHQDVIVFESPDCGRVLGLDGVIQTTQTDEYIYHEMMVHPALFAHGAAAHGTNPPQGTFPQATHGTFPQGTHGAIHGTSPQGTSPQATHGASPQETHDAVLDVLIVGGGDGGCAREVLKHAKARVTMVEIDQRVLELCRQFLPDHSAGAFDNPRLRLIIADAARFVADTSDRFDAIIVDSTDPIGPGEVLFQEPFYRHCQACLKPGGVLVAQNGVPFLQSAQMAQTHRILSQIFRDATVFLATIPTYAGGVMAFSWASDHPNLRDVDTAQLYARMGADFPVRFYDEAVHQAAFALPRDVAAILAQNHTMKETRS